MLTLGNLATNSKGQTVVVALPTWRAACSASSRSSSPWWLWPVLEELGIRAGGEVGATETCRTGPHARLAIAVYGRDAAHARLLAKAGRFLLYRDSGPSLTLTRLQQVEHEAFVTLRAGQAQRDQGERAVSASGLFHVRHGVSAQW